MPKLTSYRVIVVDNGSTDDTANIARRLGAESLTCPQRGYGSAVMTGLNYLREKGISSKQIVAVFDADGTSPVEAIKQVSLPLKANAADLVIAQRTHRERGAMPLHARFGNWLATSLIWGFTGKKYVDMGPLRALTWGHWERLRMQDLTWGWNVEMQVKAVLLEMRIREIEIHYASRVYGKSKISGSLSGSIRAGVRILWSVPYYFCVARTLRMPRTGVKDRSESDM